MNRPLLGIPFAAFALAGCHTTTQEPDPEERQAQVLREFPGLGITILPDAASAGDGGPRITSLSARQTPLTELLFALFKDSGINLLVEADTSGTATFDIKDATVAEAFQVIMSAFDLAYRWDGTFLRITSTERRTFAVDLPNTSSSGSSSSEGGSGDSGNSSDSSSGGGDSAAASSDSASDSSSSSSSSGSSGSLWTRLQADLRTLTQADAEARVVVNPLLGTVVAEGRPASVRRVAEYIDVARRRASRQVSIEARILEVQLTDGFRAGIDFSAFPAFFDSGKTGLAAGGAIVGQSLASGSDALQVGFLKPGQFSLFLDLLQSRNQVRVLSSPRVSTLNNMPAAIRVVEQVPVIEREIIDTNGVSRTQFSVRFEDAGVTVLVTPQIGEDGTISCQIAPSIIEVGGYISTPDNLVTEPILNTRSITTTLQVEDGQTAVLGGLRSRRKTENLSQIPLLGDLPVLGSLFSTTTHDSVETELLIILHPRILTNAWNDEDLDRGIDRLLRLRRPFHLSSIAMDEGDDAWRQTALGGQPRHADGDPRPERAVLPAAPDTRVLTRGSLAQLSLQRAFGNLDHGHVEQGRQDLAEALQLDPALAKGWLLRGVVDLVDARYAAARSALQRAAMLDPADAVTRSNLGVLELRAGSPVAAEGHFRAALANHDHAALHNNLAIALLQQGDLTGAVAACERAIAVDESLAEAWANLAICRLRQGNRDAAAAATRYFLLRGGDLRDPRLATVRSLLQDLTMPSPSAAESQNGSGA